MTLKNFVKKYVCPNSLIELWTKDNSGHKLIYKDDERCPNNIDAVCMEWELLQGKSWHHKYLDCKVIGVKDIYCDDFYREAINIVIEVD